MEQQCEVNEIKEIREANATNSIEEWLQLLQDADNSDMTRKQWCEANGISLRRFYYWQQKLREHDQPDDIAEENGGSQVGTFCELQIPVARVGDGDAEAEQDGSQEEDNGNPGGRGGGYGGGRKDRKPKTTRKEAFAGLPRQNVYELDVDELNRISCMIEVRRFHDLLCAGLRPGMISVISDISLIRTFWLFRHCHFQSSLINERLHNG